MLNLKEDNQDNIFLEFGKDLSLTGNTSRFKEFHVKDLWKFHGNQQYVWTKSAFSEVIFRRNAEEKKRYILPTKAESVVEFKVLAPRVGIDFSIGISGSCEALGNWNPAKALPMNCSSFPEWNIALPDTDLPKLIEYKYVIIDNKTGEIFTWEAGGNRLAYLENNSQNNNYKIDDNLFRFPDNNLKKAGVSLPVFSIRTKNSFGVGEFTDLKQVINWAVKTGLTLIQVLPVNDTVSTHSFLDSYPYKAISVFALHPLYLNIFNMGKLSDEKTMKEFKNLQVDLNKKPTVDYDLVMRLKTRYARLLFNEKKDTFLKSKPFKDFFKANKTWLEPYAAFGFLRDKMGTSDFSLWGEYKVYNSRKVKDLFDIKSKNYEELSFWYFVQFHLDKQLSEASKFAHDNRIVLKGDIPIGISRYSTDAWFEPRLYHFDGQAGAPPDDFSVDGQNWGFPTYNWKEMEKDNYQWWRNRLTKMAEYFDAYRIDHILGFFRIWEIPYHAVQGILGHFRPSLPLSKDELNQRGVWFEMDRLCKPYIRGHFLSEIFNIYTEEVIEKYLVETEYSFFALRNEVGTQRLIYDHFVHEKELEELTEKESAIMWGLIKLAAEVVLLPVDGLPEHYHPRISMHSTHSYKELDWQTQERLNEVYIHYFYHRHEQFWKEQAMQKLPALVNATNMLICGEDLGMIPASVPEVMTKFGILSLEIQRMPKDPKKDFAHPADAPVMSVCTTSTHDMSTIRAWWEENREKTQLFYNQQLGRYDEVPNHAEPWVCKTIISQHLHSPAMWSIFPIQDLLAMDEELRYKDTHSERINDPANPRQYWRYRLHMYLEDLLKAKDFNNLLKQLVSETYRDTVY